MTWAAKGVLLRRALEAGRAGGLPGDHVALLVGQGHDRVVEGRLDVGVPHRDVLPRAPPGAATGHLRSCQRAPRSVVWAWSRPRRPCAACRRCAWGPCACGRSSWCAGRAREAAPVAQAAVAADLHQALDVVRALAAEVALDGQRLLDDVAQAADLLLGEVAHVRVAVDARRLEHRVGRRAADAVDVGQPDLDPLLAGMLTPAMRAISPAPACGGRSGRSRAACRAA